MGIEGAVEHLLVIPIRHAYAALWRLGLIETQREEPDHG